MTRTECYVVCCGNVQACLISILLINFNLILHMTRMMAYPKLDLLTTLDSRTIQPPTNIFKITKHNRKCTAGLPILPLVCYPPSLLHSRCDNICWSLGVLMGFSLLQIISILFVLIGFIL